MNTDKSQFVNYSKSRFLGYLCGIISSLFSFGLGYNFGFRNFSSKTIGVIFGITGVLIMAIMGAKMTGDVFQKIAETNWNYNKKSIRLMAKYAKITLTVFVSVCASINVTYLTHKMLWPFIDVFSLLFSIPTFLTTVSVGIWSIIETVKLVEIMIQLRMKKFLSNENIVYFLGYIIGLLSAWSIFPLTMTALKEYIGCNKIYINGIALIATLTGALLLSYGTANALEKFWITFFHKNNKKHVFFYKNKVLKMVALSIMASFSAIPRIQMAIEYISYSKWKILLVACCATGRFCLDYWFLNQFLGRILLNIPKLSK